MFKKISAEDISASLEVSHRQYLIGKLKLPQILSHIDDDNIEIGLTSYKEYNIELPHKHKMAFEYQYIISGETKYLDLHSGEEFYYAAGDFYRIDPGTEYAQKSLEDTSILFIKTPQGNDKVVLEQSPALKKWFSSWDAEI
ncbi:cupin [Sedimentibacter hydroxybenzoicus DSM 7310]|uniref:Cupin n=1 Tax=Sedimentibacter hydroxybenzoicus DSM 7310 TaxID=1123245 RepID=A0A974BKF9_SEDHY|nr:cupin domain-containing protein [Sedimentibacter hydroxybenzoicus]NYB74516.1 cupin [Sedimentibacter hydroxybenzoicus DSM 7310]